MKKIFLHIFLLTFGFVKISNGQFYFLEDAHEQLEVKFLKKKIETEVNNTFFNILKIKNPSTRKLTFNTNISYPSNWTFIGEKQQQITLSPGDSILIPFRASPSVLAKGEIGYSVVASLSDLNGNIVKTEYSFVNIPKKQQIKITPVERVIYIDQLKKTATAQIFISNNGNTDELFYIDYIIDNHLTTPGIKEGFYRQEVLLNPYKDTIMELPILKQNERDVQSEKFYRINFRAYTKDTSINSSIWAKELVNKFYNEIQPGYKFLTAEVIAQNLFSDLPTTFATTVEGNYLLKKAGDIGYRIQSLNAKFYEEPFKQGRYYLTYKHKGIDLFLGDILGDRGQNMFGKGIDLSYRFLQDNTINIVASQNLFSDRKNAALSYKREIKRTSLEIGGSYVIDDQKLANITGTYLSGKMQSRKYGNFTINLAGTFAEWERKDNPQLGLGGALRYYHTIDDFLVILSSRYGDRAYFGKYNGKVDFKGLTRYFLSDRTYIDLNYTYFLNDPTLYVNDYILPAVVSQFEEGSTNYNFYKSNNTLISAGLIYNSRYANYLKYADRNINFRTRSAMVSGAIRFRNGYTKNYFVLSGNAGATFVTDHTSIKKSGLNNSWFKLYISGNYRSPHWGLYTTYYHGPHAANQQFVYFLSGVYAKSIRIMPYFDVFLYPGIVKLQARPNYNYDITSKTSRFNASTELTGFIGKTFKVTLAASYNLSSNIDQITEDRYTYSGTYFELRLKKDFNFNQPRYQHYNVEFYFFKDLNGNGVKDNDEPGLKDILLSIKKDEDKELLTKDLSTGGYFTQTDLLSDVNGYVRYDNIPNGFYILNYFSISEIKGAFTAESKTKAIQISKDEVYYIPFVENNKIFGKVILNRSKLSNLGQIDPGNIKVTAEDSKGKKYSTLTDNKGNFTIYVPNIDKFIVRINNIFFENFELEQNNYEVQLNGYRQFEVNFIFNEKRRKINFTSSYDYGARLDGPGVEIVRRTNLSGTVKDATTLKPVVATIKVLDGEGHEVTTAKSSLKTGVFTASFVAGDNYSIEVVADDYWFHAEKLYSQQIVTFKNLKKDILLKNITVGSLIPMKTLNFEAGSYDIPATSFPELERLMKVLKKNPTVKIAVHGHADDLEILDSETDLALERAKLVAKYLIANGYNRVKYVGHANTKPIADNDTEDGRRLNRRVEIVVTGK